jgi:hypothetical protein
MKNGRKWVITPKISNPAEYLASCQNWWMALQPQWRQLNEDGCFYQEVPETVEERETLRLLRRGGPNGFFIVILAFSWCVEAMDGKLVDSPGLRDTLNDLIWVVKCMANMPDPEDDPDTPTTKQYVLSF